MLKHQLVGAALACAALTFSAIEARTAVLPPIDVPHASGITPVRGFGGGGFGHFGGGGFGHFGGGGFGHFGGGFGHFGGGFRHFGGGFRHFGGFGFRRFGFAPHRAFVGHFHRVAIGHFHRAIFVRRFPRRVFFRRAFFVGVPLYGYYAYGGACAWLRYRALVTGSPYWWQRYRWCVGW